ncbi:NADH-quinone oxidoreductase subunit C [Methanoplanus limicola]|uniref:NADH dehydrogenase (Ubiquinone) 30 kDa subunit n=1 Tax=Methanoplanus limicola DSM 2279 TaxID=937775 RepID=H1YX70_9EURY|nr:NADH-quinone oxidoreductase subunit C [Methanoplanus limicola]EHQ35873.1 NADH dehydrogenase (ubiquinone) 30 kDa subunit [Methanoplanus limicola DSM 2279]
MTIEDQLLRDISVEELPGEVKKKSDDGYRLVQIGCTKIDDIFEINYSFEKDYRFENLRITISGDTVVPSISDSYWGSFIYENEMHDLYDIKVKGMNVDFNGYLFKTSIPHPFNDNITVKKVPSKKKNNGGGE